MARSKRYSASPTPGLSAGLSQQFVQSFSGSVNGASLAIFRICFGLAVAWSMFKYLQPAGNTTLAGAVYSQVGWHFTYPGFSWVQPLPQPWLNWHFIITGIAGLLLAMGLFYRAAAVVVFLGYTWYFLLDQTYFNNHYYLISLFAFLLIWMPADRCWAIRWPGRMTDGCVPFWAAFLLRAQFLIVYLFAALAKFNADWLTGEPMIGTGSQLLASVESWMPLPTSIEAIHVSLALAWMGLVFDLLIGFLLLLPRTRLLAVALLGVFHGINQLTLPIGVFPFLGFTGSLIFLDPSWPVQLGRWLRAPQWIAPDWNWCRWGVLAVPGFGALLGWRLPDDPANQVQAPRPTRFVTALIVAWLVIQIVVPLRHFFIAGDASWTEEGQLFAWRMMLRQKASGHITVHVADAGLIQKNQRGQSVLDWSQSPDVATRAIYIPIDGPRFQWRDHPGVSTVYEGLVGYRMIYVPSTESAADLAQLAAHWSQKTGQRIEVQKAIPLRAALADVAANLQRQADDSQQKEDLVLARLSAEALQLYDALPPGGDRREEQLSELQGRLLTLGNRDREGLVSRALSRVQPFELAGAAPSPTPLYIVDQAATAEGLQKISAQLGKPESYIVWCDFTRLQPFAWQVLPPWFPVHEEGQLKILWNYFHELSIPQTEALAAQPYLIQQYSKEIARRWEQDYGRRPEIQAYTSVMMNYRYPHPLVDPKVDLANVEYSHWNHNAWILPLDHRKVNIAEQVQRGRTQRR